VRWAIINTTVQNISKFYLALPPKRPNPCRSSTRCVEANTANNPNPPFDLSTTLEYQRPGISTAFEVGPMPVAGNNSDGLNTTTSQPRKYGIVNQINDAVVVDQRCIYIGFADILDVIVRQSIFSSKQQYYAPKNLIEN